MRAIRRFTVRTALPVPLRPLGELATNLRWSWHAATREVFAAVDPATWEAVAQLSAAMEPDEVVLGGGGVAELDELPPGCRRGANENAFLGGFRLWDPDWAAHLTET